MHSRAPKRDDDLRSLGAVRPPDLPARSAALDTAAVLALQRSAGNHAVIEWLTPARPMLQRLKPGDPLPSHETEISKRVTAQTRVGNPRVIAAVQHDLQQGQLLAETAAKLQAAGKQVLNDVSPAVQRVLTAAFTAATSWDDAYGTAQKLAFQEELAFLTSRTTVPTGPLVTVPEFVEEYLQRCHEAAVSSRVADLSKRQTLIVGLPENKRKPFSEALKKMQFVQLILTSKTRDPNVKASQVAAWKDGKNLHEPSNVKEETDKQPPSDQVRGDLENGSFMRRLEEADRFIKLVVEPHLLALLAPPSVVAHTKYGEKTFSPWSWFPGYRFRAFQNAGAIHVAQDETTAIIVHEVGHYLETNLPPEAWTDLSVLRRERHTAGGGALTATPIGSSKTEGRFAGNYPATSEYTSRAYAGGETEIMSMTLEFLKRPEHTLTMIEQDPVQTAVVLRGLRPREYEATKELRDFDDYLPESPP